jgi:hypothetical protein
VRDRPPLCAGICSADQSLGFGGRAYFDGKKAAGKTSNESMRCLKRRLSDMVYRHRVDDAVNHAIKNQKTGPGGQRGTDSASSVTGSHPRTGSSDKSHPGPAPTQPKTPTPTAS